MLDTILQLAGRAHPLLLHLPIGMLVALVSLEILALPEYIKLDPRLRIAFAWMIGVAAAFSVATGLLLENEPAYAGGGQTLSLHKWFGVGVGVCALLMAMSLFHRKTRKLYPVLIVLSLAGLIPTGHLGASMTHGEGFLTEPLFPRPPQPVRGSTGGAGVGLLSHQDGVYARQIAPIFERYCISCHGDSRMQGKLALNTPESILLGGSTGPAIEPGDPAGSELLLRMHLPITDRDHMPPKVRPQPDDATVRLIEAWIAAGAPFEGGDALPVEPVPTSSPADLGSASPAPSVSTERRAAPVAAVAALRARQLHVELIEPESGLLWVSFEGAGAIGDEDAASLLQPVSEYVADLSLSGRPLGGRVLAVVADMPSLRKLSLARTGCTIPQLESLLPCIALTELNLCESSLDDRAIQLLTEGFARLERIYLWSSGISPASIAELRSRRPSLTVVQDTLPGDPLETEPVPLLTTSTPSGSPTRDPAKPPQ